MANEPQTVPCWKFEAIPVPRLVEDDRLEPTTLPDGTVIRSWRPHDDDWEAWMDYCEKRGWYPLNSARMAWCGSLETYLRGATWLATHAYTGAVEVVDDDEKAILEKETRPRA